MYGTTYFCSSYFNGVLIQGTPAPAPIVPPVRHGTGYDDAVNKGFEKWRKKERDDKDRMETQTIDNRTELALSEDEEDVAIIISLWLNMK